VAVSVAAHTEHCLLHGQASTRAPAIIFLDEIDALVPARSARAGGSDQIYASVVSTLLSLMDGVTDRGAVIVIGATNRRGAPRARLGAGPLHCAATAGFGQLAALVRSKGVRRSAHLRPYREDLGSSAPPPPSPAGVIESHSGRAITAVLLG
jgi:ATPase family associated with various cellular activities (AAA)